MRYWDGNFRHLTQTRALRYGNINDHFLWGRSITIISCLRGIAWKINLSIAIIWMKIVVKILTNVIVPQLLYRGVFKLSKAMKLAFWKRRLQIHIVKCLIWWQEVRPSKSSYKEIIASNYRLCRFFSIGGSIPLAKSAWKSTRGIPNRMIWCVSCPFRRATSSLPGISLSMG